ncbi:protein draper isoform X3 [Hermetia illucens]|uniref:protein draper isoform X3 n=1 Tax=Hermetia illucens TaxID=343691 RepID=UPI0018CC2D0B|nr:protein draper isoform X3 [Hermetia illucens]
MKAIYKTYLIALSLFAVILLTCSENAELDGPNVCRRLEQYQVEVVTTEKQSYQVRENVWCFNVPPRCTTYKIKQRTVNKTQLLNKTRPVKECCEGYGKNPSGDRCIPICNQTCLHGVCSAPNHCKCEPGFGGPSCDICVHCETKCKPGYYGEACDKICTCQNNSSCDPVSGRCICSNGWIGEDCSEPCAEGYYGAGCRERCPEIAHGNMSCHHVTGKFICAAGFTGMLCENPCSPGTYGLGCNSICKCEHGGECSHLTGECQCPPGWSGPSCNKACPEGFYGNNCSQVCKCKNESKCRKNDGHCLCPPGWMGVHCEDVCPDGFFGNHCMEPCACPSQNFVCHAAYGCICRQGLTGPNCDIQTSLQRVQVTEDSPNKAGLAFGIVAALIGVGILIGVLLYYRRRVSNLKTEIAHVAYMADPQSLSDRHNFDNPVYGMQTGADNTRLLNNLRPKMNNLDRGSGPSDYDDNSNASSRAGTYSINFNTTSEKNYNADLTNPNVYHSIDEASKEEHVYDEIKQKEGFSSPGMEYRKNIFKDEYDHLDYSRPGSSFKPHYHRMNELKLNIKGEDDEKTSTLFKPKNIDLPTENCSGGSDNSNEEAPFHPEKND